MDQSQHDELAALFAQRMNFAPGGDHQAQQIQQQQQQTFMEPVAVPQISEKHEETPIHYISSHYNHSYHVRHDTLSEPSRSPPPPYYETMLTTHMAQTFRNHSIDPSTLLPNQLHLYANADLDQRLRLLELWRISPPSYSHSAEEQLHGAQNPTNLAQEELSARQRYEAQHPSHFDTHIEPPRITPIRQAGEPAWPPAARMRAASIASSKPSAHQMSDAEPYIMDGYQSGGNPPQFQSASSIEPVYAASSGLWPGQEQQQQGGIEEQYGAFMQIRNHADWEAMNERIARERFGMVVHSGGNGGDDDMIM